LVRRLRRAIMSVQVVVNFCAIVQAVGDTLHFAQCLVALLCLRIQFQRALIVAVVLEQNRRVQRAGRHIPVCAELLEARHRLAVVQPRVLVQPHRPVDQSCVRDAAGDAERVLRARAPSDTCAVGGEGLVVLAACAAHNPLEGVAVGDAPRTVGALRTGASAQHPAQAGVQLAARIC
jgi:hypothetical protein